MKCCSFFINYSTYIYVPLNYNTKIFVFSLNINNVFMYVVCTIWDNLMGVENRARPKIRNTCNALIIF